MKNIPIVMTEGKGWNSPARVMHQPALEQAAEKVERAYTISDLIKQPAEDVLGL